MYTQGSRWSAHEDDQRIDKLAAVRIVAPVVVVVIVAIVMVTMPRRTQVAFTHVVKRYGVCVNAVVAVVVQQQPVRERHPRQQRKNQRRRHRNSTR